MTATAKAALTTAQWADRAVAAAVAHHMIGTARYIGTFTGGDGKHWQAYRALRVDRCGSHVVELHEGAAHPECGCIAGSYGVPCCHAGAVIHAERQRAAALAVDTRETFDSFRHNSGGW